MLRGLGVRQAHVAGFSGGSLTAQELALRHPDLVRSLVLVSTWGRPGTYTLRVGDALSWMMGARAERARCARGVPGFVSTARAHQDGMVDEIADDMLAFPFGQSLDGFRRQQRAWMSHDSLDRVSAIRVPTLVVAGGQDSFIPAALGRDVADRIPGAELVVLPDEAHQPFQERPEQFNEMVDAFWVRVDRTPRG